MKDNNGDNFDIVKENREVKASGIELSENKFVQACITNVSFPQDIHNLQKCLRKIRSILLNTKLT